MLLKFSNLSGAFSVATCLALLVSSNWAQNATINLPDSIADPGTQVIWVKPVAAYCEGPAVDAGGVLYFTEQRGNQTQTWPIWKIDPADANDTGMVFLASSSQANGLQFDINNKLVAAQAGRITRYNADASVDAVLATSGNGATFNQANDLSVSSDGRVYFTALGNSVYYVDLAGNLRTVYTSASGANGIEFLEELDLVYLNEANGGRITRLNVAGNGDLQNPTTFANASVPDGATFDEHGNYYTASYSGGAVLVFDSQGRQIGSITLQATGQWDARAGQQGNVSNCSFGGPQYDILYITGDGGAYSIQLKIPGRRLPGTVGLKNHFDNKSFFHREGHPFIYRSHSPIHLSHWRTSNKAAVYDIRNKLIAEWDPSAGHAFRLPDNVPAGIYWIQSIW